MMRPLNRMLTVTPEMPVLKALELMTSQKAEEVAVLSEGNLQGIFSRAQVMRFLQVYSGGGYSRDMAA